MSEEKNVSTPVDAYNEMQSWWQLPLDLVAGTKAMRERGETYTPRNGLSVDDRGRATSPAAALDRDSTSNVARWEGETVQSYRKRLNITFLYSYYLYTLLSLQGKVFSKVVNVDNRSPANIKEWADTNIDMEGNDLNTFGRNVFLEGLNLGLSHIFVDMPDIGDEPTLADQLEAGARPYFIHLSPESVIGWKYDKTASGYELSQLRYVETIEIEDGEFHTQQVEQIKVCSLTTVLANGRDERRMVIQIYRKVGDGDDWLEMPEERKITSIGYIPLVTFYTNKKGRLIGKPPLMALAEKNLEHWQATSNQKVIVNTGRVPIMFQSGEQGSEDSLTVGAYRLVYGPEGADLKYVEVSGEGAKIGWKDLETIEQQMEMLSMAPILNQHTGQVTATEAAIDTVVASSNLQAWAIEFRQTLQTAFRYMSDWIDEQQETLINLDTENNLLVLHNDDWEQLREDVKTGILSKTTYRQIVQDRQYWPSKIDLANEQQRINEERGSNPEQGFGEISFTSNSSASIPTGSEGANFAS